MGRFALIAVLLIDLFVSSHAVSGYLSYDDALCVDTYTIKGTIVYSYDDSDYADYGFSMAHYGGCMYFKGGSFDLDSWDYSTDYYDYGTCVTCDGYVGCSSDGSCDNFMTYPVETSSQGYQQTLSGNKRSSSQEVAAPKLGLASKAKQASLYGVQSSSKQSGDEGVKYTKSFPTAGVVMGSFALVVFAASVGELLRRSRATRSSAESEMISIDYVHAQGALA